MSKHKPGYRKAHRAKLKGLGLCVRCGKEKEDTRLARLECESCAASHKIYCKRTYNKQRRSEFEKTQRKDRAEKGLCTRCGKVPPISTSINCQKCIDRSTIYYNKIKEAAYAAYGGYICICCGETIQQFLTLDHINNDGCKHRRLINGPNKPNRNGIGSGKDLYLWLKKNDYPTGFQILCMNCNLGKSRNGGVCPHNTQ